MLGEKDLIFFGTMILMASNSSYSYERAKLLVQKAFDNIFNEEEMVLE